MRPQEGCTFNQVNIWHITPARPPACLCLALPSRKPRCLCRCEGSSLSPRSNLNEANSHQSSETEFFFFHQYNDPYMLLLFYEWNSQRSSYTCVSAFVCAYERQVQKVPIMRQSAKWSILQICVYTCVRVCVFEVPQRYQILADMPNWTYCRLGRWRGPKRSFGNNVPPSPPGEG